MHEWQRMELLAPAMGASAVADREVDCGPVHDDLVIWEHYLRRALDRHEIAIDSELASRARHERYKKYLLIAVAVAAGSRW